MHPALVFTATYGPQIAGWLLDHRDTLGDAFAHAAGYVYPALASREAEIDRIGPVLVGLRDEQTEVLGLLHQHTRQLDAVADGVAAVGDGVGLLTTLAGVGLGVSVLSQAHLAFQFHRLTARLARVEAAVQDVKDMVQAGFRGDTTTQNKGTGHEAFLCGIGAGDIYLDRRLVGVGRRRPNGRPGRRSGH